MYFIYLEKDAKRYYLVEAHEAAKNIGYEVYLAAQDEDGSPPNGSVYWINIDDVHYELERLKQLAPEFSALHVDKRKWMQLSNSSS